MCTLLYYCNKLEFEIIKIILNILYSLEATWPTTPYKSATKYKIIKNNNLKNDNNYNK